MAIMKTRQTRSPGISWDRQTGFTNKLISCSPEHHGAHDRLLELAVEMETDFEPYGKRPREGPDCSCGCRHFATLEGVLGADWGVCMNKRSPRAGLLTFEHQGCPEFETGVDPENVASR
jgi:hypothetical protein